MNVQIEKQLGRPFRLVAGIRIDSICQVGGKAIGCNLTNDSLSLRHPILDPDLPCGSLLVAGLLSDPVESLTQAPAIIDHPS